MPPEAGVQTCWQNVSEMEPSVLLTGRKLVQPLWEKDMKFPQVKNRIININLEILLLGIVSEEKNHPQMNISVLSPCSLHCLQ